MGLSVGRSIVGNMGSDTMKKLCFLEKRLDGIDEWMYEMSARKQIDPFHLLNEAMAKYLSGDCSRECAEHLASASPLAIAKGDYHTRSPIGSPRTPRVSTTARRGWAQAPRA